MEQLTRSTLKSFINLVSGIGLLTVLPVALFAQPVLQQVVDGSATVNSTSATTVINQQSNQASINWRSYDVSQDHTVTYNQPSTSSIAINNILGANPSQILGNINANGRVILLNPNGFYIGPNSSISASTFIAAAANQQNTSYDQRTNVLTVRNRNANQLRGNIQVLGKITASDSIQLIARNVEFSAASANLIAGNQIAIEAQRSLTILPSATSTSSIDIFDTANLHLTQSTGDFVIDSEVNLPGTNITITTSGGSILTTTTVQPSPFGPRTYTINARDIVLNAALDLGSSSNPFVLNSSSSSIAINTTANSSFVFLSDVDNAYRYFQVSTFNTRNLFVVQQFRNFRLFASPISLPDTNLTLAILSGGISSRILDPAIHARRLVLVSRDGIPNPIALEFNGPLTVYVPVTFLPSFRSTIFLRHSTDISQYLRGNIVASNLFLQQDTGDILINSEITLRPSARLTLIAVTGGIHTSLTTTAFNNRHGQGELHLITHQSDVGSLDRPIILDDDFFGGGLTIGASSAFLSGVFSNLQQARLRVRELSVTQENGDILISSPFRGLSGTTFIAASITLTAVRGGIFTTLTSSSVIAQNVNLNAFGGDIGSPEMPIIVESGTTNVNAGTNQAFVNQLVNPN